MHVAVVDLLLLLLLIWIHAIIILGSKVSLSGYGPLVQFYLDMGVHLKRVT